MRPWCAAILIGLASAAPLRAADNEVMQLFLTTPAARPRSSAMLPVEARFVVKTGELMRGRLHLTLHDVDGGAILSWASPPLALTRGEHHALFLLPPFNANNIDGSVQATAVFAREGARTETIDFGRITIGAPTWHSRNTTMLVSDPWMGSVQRNAELLRGLRMDTIEPRGSDQTTAMQERVSTLPVRMKPDDLPMTAIEYCAYDLVVLIDEGLTSLSQKQLDAITAWVEAGGSVYVAPPREMEAWQARFVAHLGTSPSDHTPAPLNGIAQHRVELGRAAVHTGARDVYDEPAWRNTIAFLWKLTRQQRGDVAKDGVWSTRRQEIPEHELAYMQQFRSDGSTPAQPPIFYQPTATQQEASLYDILQPLTMRFVPFHLIIAMLVGYVLLIGPVDYFVLTRLGLRKLTWVTFPIITVAMTLATVAMTDDYMGRNDHRRKLVIIDVSSDGRELRRTVIELSVLGKSQPLTETGRAALLAQPDPQRVGFAYYNPNYGRPNYNTHAERETAQYTGRFPGAYEMTRHIQQWSPSLMRRTTIDPKSIDHNINWQPGQTFHHQIHELTVRPKRGFFSVVSQISPTGGPCLEDLAIGDTTDGGQRVYWEFNSRGQDIYLYRKVLWKDAP